MIMWVSCDSSLKMLLIRPSRLCHRPRSSRQDESGGVRFALVSFLRRVILVFPWQPSIAWSVYVCTQVLCLRETLFACGIPL
jgi:hypothetical protein